MHRHERILFKLGRFFIYLAIASPLVWYIKMLFPYQAPQIYLFQLATIAATIAYLFLNILNPQYRPRWNLLIGATTLYLVIQGLTLIGSIAPLNSFIGSADRMLGVFNLLHYYLFFMTLVGLFRSKDDVKRIIGFTLIIATLASFRYLVTIFDLFNHNIDIRFESVRVPFGNSSFFGNYLAVLMPLAFWLLLQSKKRTTRLWIIGYILLQSIVVLRLGSRAALLGILVASALYIAPFALKNRRVRLASLGAAALIGILAATLIINRDTHFVESRPILYKFANTTFNDDSNSTRIVLARVGWNAFKERPLFGWGHENIGFAFEKHYDPQFPTEQNAEVWTDRIHNNFLHILAVSGIVGLAGYLILLAAFCYAVRKVWLHKETREFAFLMGIFFIVYLIQVFFSFDSSGTLLPFYMALGLLGIYYAHLVPQSAKKTKPIFTNSLAIGTLAVTTFFFTIQPIKASYHGGNSLFFLPYHYEPFIQEIEALEASIPDYLPIKAGFYSVIAADAHAAAQITRQHPRIVKFENFLIPHMFDISSKHQTDIRLQHRIGVILKDRAFRNNIEAEPVIKYWEAFLPLSPNRQYVLIHLAELNSKFGDVDLALGITDKLIALQPELSAPHWLKGQILFNHGRTDEARQSFLAALKMGYNIEIFNRENVIVANLLSEVSEGLPYAIRIYQTAIGAEPENANYWANLAFLYGKDGQLQLARTHALRARELDPEHAEDIDAFLQQLDSRKIDTK
ncbi:hypothetical protein COV82_00290 [Candidatus Peregrinibacteria bacterium CG11_big_fil_rev_8_21_14_0_20_46_8]|nr:MAG: hypothetical protein COV82_00290 [Candidatus Peregrinibacteria bacterium CG11_big_fil_rev_8_21_14_0_20_46_8]